MSKKHDPIKSERTRLIRALGGPNALPDNAAEIIDAVLRLATVGGACREREHTKRVLEIRDGAMPIDGLMRNTYGIWQDVIATSVRETTGIEAPGKFRPVAVEGR